MSDEGVGVARTEVEPKPEGSSQGEQLARQKIHLCGREADEHRFTAGEKSQQTAPLCFC